MELASPELVRSVGDLPIITICLLVIFGQFFMTVSALKELRTDVRALTQALNALLVRLTERASRGEMR